MNTYRNALLAKLHILLKRQGAEDHKAEIYAQYGAQSAAEMSNGQLLHLIGMLDGSDDMATQADIKRVRSEVLCLLTRSATAGDPRRRGLGIPNDWDVLNPWIKRHAGKLLSKQSMDELEVFRRKLLALREKGWAWSASSKIVSDELEQAFKAATEHSQDWAIGTRHLPS